MEKKMMRPIETLYEFYVRAGLDQEYEDLGALVARRLSLGGMDIRTIDKTKAFFAMLLTEQGVTEPDLLKVINFWMKILNLRNIRSKARERALSIKAVSVTSDEVAEPLDLSNN